MEIEAKNFNQTRFRLRANHFIYDEPNPSGF
jgi:hypothetical protein